MATYRNKKTGATITTDLIISGGDWEIEEKKRCWHVEYDDVPNFHMDVIPAHTYGSVIRITDHNEDYDTYDYLGSNPAGYVKWFFDACAKQRNRFYEPIIRY